MGFGGPSIPEVKPLPMPPPAAHPPTLGSVAATSSITAKKSSGQQNSGFSGTIATSPQGLTEKASTSKATLLGQ